MIDPGVSGGRVWVVPRVADVILSAPIPEHIRLGQPCVPPGH